MFASKVVIQIVRFLYNSPMLYCVKIHSLIL